MTRGSRESDRIALRLYVAGAAPNSTIALLNLKKLEDGPLRGRIDLEVIDVLQRPERALSDSVLVTPTLVKLAPLPTCRVVGNLSSTEAVLRALGVWDD